MLPQWIAQPVVTKTSAVNNFDVIGIYHYAVWTYRRAFFGRGDDLWTSVLCDIGKGGKHI